LSIFQPELSFASLSLCPEVLIFVYSCPPPFPIPSAKNWLLKILVNILRSPPRHRNQSVKQGACSFIPSSFISFLSLSMCCFGEINLLGHFPYPSFYQPFPLPSFFHWPSLLVRVPSSTGHFKEVFFPPLSSTLLSRFCSPIFFELFPCTPLNAPCLTLLSALSLLLFHFRLPKPALTHRVTHFFSP